jgi:hypothetical protein
VPGALAPLTAGGYGSQRLQAVKTLRLEAETTRPLFGVGAMASGCARNTRPAAACTVEITSVADGRPPLDDWFDPPAASFPRMRDHDPFSESTKLTVSPGGRRDCRSCVRAG